MPELIIHKDGRTIRASFDGTKTVREILIESGISFEHPCGGHGICGQCRIRIDGELSEMSPRELERGNRLSCETRIVGDAELFLDPVSDLAVLRDEAQPNQSTDEDGVFAAADIGTTTIALSLYHGSQPFPFFSTGAENPQRRIADDVSGRIAYVQEHGGESLKRDVRDTLMQLAGAGGKTEAISRWVITGNTTMLYLLTGRNPKALGQAPFEPDFHFDETINFGGKPAYLPPCIHGFIGADLTCSVLASGICDRTQTALLCDLGTNGELALWTNGKLYVTSVAMGPALEGFGIRHGCGAREGAIDRVTLTGNGMTVHTIGGREAVGLCGSGVIDAVACGLERGIIEADGRMERPMILENGIGLYPEDVQAVLLTKAALNAGMARLTQAAGIREEEIQSVILCGGFGNRINLIHAAAIRLIPPAFPGKTTEIGNAALRGAAMLREPGNIKKIREIVSRSRIVQLGGDPDFNQIFLQSLHF